MRSTSILYNFIVLYLLFSLLITLTESQNYFNYTESKLGDQNIPPLIADIKTYDDGTILVHIIRNESKQTDECSKIHGMSLEQKLRIRIISINGTVKEIDPKLNLDPINSINYCLLNGDKYKISKPNNIITYLNDTKNNNFSILHNLVNPITIYPLQKPFILVTYVNTTNSSDPTSYKECGEVIDWDGNSRSNMCFNPDDSGAWINSTIRLNANKKLGFLRFAHSTYSNGTIYRIWRQYSIDDNGNLTYLTNVTYLMPNFGNAALNFSYSLITIVPTIDSGYLAIFQYTQRNNNHSLTAYGGLCANLIRYNQTVQTSRSIDIYPLVHSDSIIKSVYCDEANIMITCIIFLSSNTTTYYIQIYITSSGSETEPPTIHQSQQGLSAKIMPVGGYILGATVYDNNDNDNNAYYYIHAYDDINNTLSLPEESFLTNNFGVNAITQNNTFLLASPYTNDNITWSLLTIPLPLSNKTRDHNYDNVLINETIPSINATIDLSTAFLNITFFCPIEFSTSKSNITIYKASDNSIRQRVSATMNDFCKINPDGLTINIKIINSTFNEYDEQYFVTMDHNFVQNIKQDEPVKGIHDDNVIIGSVLLTQEASKKFENLETNQSAYIDNLLNEVAKKVPINRSCIRTDNITHSSIYNQIAILISIDTRNIETKRTASKILLDLNTMIIHKNITSFSLGITNDLDQDYGFQPIRNVWKDNNVQIMTIIGIIIFIIFCLLFPILIHKMKSKKFEILGSAILKLGLIIPNFILSVNFTFHYSYNVPKFFCPSIFVLGVPLVINFFIAIYTIYIGIKNPFIGANFKEWVMKYRSLVIMLTILAVTDYEYLIILKDISIFTKKLYHYEQINLFNMLEHIFGDAILWGAFFDIFFRDIPQIVIQVSNSSL
ncbi:hypothetical protein F8M41_014110 [Gigaspora margarita]|uniref:G-protein coupled receptors family 3 profile domain-containing protein n=1 Tax=Gigaspora margarita TaxID=4874 RepID=A0A8H4ARV0_GIGMA|nr:hypothetical protein F8M41_014110 [Gigaspora margarita]